MKKRISALTLGLCIASIICAQNADTLTNSSIIKMVKAKLSDELIIEVIGSSPVQFELSENSLKYLSEQNVPQKIIDVMKKAGGYRDPSKSNIFTSQQKVVPVEPEPVPVVQPSGPPVKEIPAPDDENSALGYVAPMKNLITFYEKEFENLTATMAGWDKRINSLTDASDRILDQIDQTGNKLTEKKNVDSKSFSPEILDLKKQLTVYRENYRKAQESLLEEGENITKEMEKISSGKIQAVGNVYNDVSQDIKSADADPSVNPVSVAVTLKDLEVNKSASAYISPVHEMLVWQMNEIRETREVIKKWNVKVKEVIAADNELSRQLDPLKSKLGEYQSDTKKYKVEIAALKKQISGVEKERKNLKGRMEDDSKELAGYLKQSRAEIQKTLEERFSDIIENINYSFGETK
jgi:predicted  nucleic acid-binding Zn-ribbon protein